MKKRYLIIVAIFATIAGLISLGITHQQAVAMVQQIISKDKVGDNTTADIAVLTDFVHSHTRASVSFVLEGSYQRAATAAQQAATPQANSSVYAAAQAACTVRNPVTTANCIMSYIQAHSAPGAQPKPVALPDQTTFTYQLNAPAWAPDVAGLSFLAALLCLVATVWLWFFKTVTRPSY
jgi:hypothetical protein